MNWIRLTLLLAAVFLGGLALTGCAGMGASSAEPLLSAAGFRVKTPENAKQREIYAELPPYKVQRGTYQGKTFYAYKNEKEGVAYIGTEAEYQKYSSSRCNAGSPASSMRPPR